MGGRAGGVVETVAGERAAWQAHLERLGWQVCRTSTTAEQCRAARVLAVYQGPAVHERDFARLKSRALHIQPVYLRNEQRLVGLVWLLLLGLRGRGICEARLRAELAQRGERVVGLNPASRNQRTPRPTTERVLDSCAELTLTRGRGGDGTGHGHVTPLNAPQQHIRRLRGLPTDRYARLAHGPPKLDSHLRE